MDKKDKQVKELRGKRAARGKAAKTLSAGALDAIVKERHSRRPERTLPEARAAAKLLRKGGRYGTSMPKAPDYDE